MSAMKHQLNSKNILSLYTKEEKESLNAYFLTRRNYFELGLRLPLSNLKSYKRTKPKFIEGLWEDDVLEAFISTTNNQYLEINLSPNGNWWACYFDDYRKRSNQILNTKNSPTVRLIKFDSIQLEEELFFRGRFFTNLKIPGSKFNITAITYSEDKPKYFSLNSMKALNQVDFHLALLRKHSTL